MRDRPELKLRTINIARVYPGSLGHPKPGKLKGGIDPILLDKRVVLKRSQGTRELTRLSHQSRGVPDRQFLL